MTHPVIPMDREAAFEYLKQQRRDVEAGMVVVGEYDTHAIAQLLAAYRIKLAKTLLSDDNIAAALKQSICCNGMHCGCMGATVEQYLQYQLIDRSE